MKKKFLSIIAITLVATLVFTVARVEAEKEKQIYVSQYHSMEAGLYNAFVETACIIVGREDELEKDPIQVLDHADSIFAECRDWNKSVENLKRKSKEWYGFLYPDYRYIEKLPVDTMVAHLISLQENIKLEEEEEEREKENEYKYSTYTTYLDGNIVDYNTIDINHYKITIDDEKESIFLSHKME